MAKKTVSTKKTNQAPAPHKAAANMVTQAPGGRGRDPAAGTDLGAALLPDARPAHQAGPARPVRARRAPRRHRRTLVCLDHAGGQRGAPPDEGLSYVVYEGKRAFTLRDAVASEGARLVGAAIWERYRRWPVYSKFFDNLGPIPHHMHQNNAQAALVGQQGKPESYYFPPQLNAVGNNFPYTFFGLEPGTTKADIRRCLERWNEGDNGILNYSKAYRLQPGTGWLVPPCVLHAPGSLVTYEPQWGSDVFGMYQSMVEGRPVPWELLVKDVPKDKHHDLDYLVEQLDWEANVDPSFKDHHYLEPIPVADTASEGYVDRWIVYGKVDGQELFSAKELTVNPGVQGDHQGQRRLRPDRRAGERPHRQARLADAGHDPLRRADRGRGVRQRTMPPARAWCSRTPARSRW